MLIVVGDQSAVAQCIQVLADRHRSDAEAPRDLRGRLRTLALELQPEYPIEIERSEFHKFSILTHLPFFLYKTKVSLDIV